MCRIYHIGLVRGERLPGERMPGGDAQGKGLGDQRNAGDAVGHRVSVYEVDVQAAMTQGAPAAAVLNVEELPDHTHTAHRGMVLEHEGYRAVATPIKLSRTPAALRRLPPAFGQHNAVIRKGWPSESTA